MDQLLVALDVEDGRRALQLADQLRGVAGGFKIGKRLFTLEGPSVVRALVDRGDRVFLDLKFHDIPHTVAAAVAAAVKLGVWMVNVHAAGGRSMMAAARQAAIEASRADGREPPLVIGVTVLTSMNEAALAETGVTASLMEQVVRLATLARDAGLDGVVASPQEIQAIRQVCGASFAIVTPGIRGGSAIVSAGDDQARTMTASGAVAAGATYIVVGRPVIAAEDPRAAAQAIVRSI